MDYRLPYYMAYPMPLQYDDERIEQRDFEYMKSMYPETAKRLLPYGTIGRYSPEHEIQARHYVQMYVQFCPHGSGQIKETVKLTILSCTCYNQAIKRHLGGMERIRREFKTDCISETFAGT